MFIANDDILARKEYANEVDIRPPDVFLRPNEVKASTDYAWKHDLVRFYNTVSPDTIAHLHLWKPVSR